MEDSDRDSGFEDSVVAQKPSNPRPLSPSPAPALPTIPLSGFTHSLVPDMVLGWRPPALPNRPIPLYYNKSDLPHPINPLTHHEFPVIYHGLRPRDTVLMHQCLSKGGYLTPNCDDYDAFEYMMKRDSGLKDDRPFVGMQPGLSMGLTFDSAFECGNLDKVIALSNSEFDLYIRADVNTAGYFMWYYFSVHTESRRTIRLNIVNFTRSEGLYKQGMMPMAYVEQMPAWGWHRAGEKVKFGESRLNRRVEGKRTYYSLSFSYTFQLPGQKVLFAYSVPYPYSYLFKTVNDLTRSPLVRKEVIGRSLSGLDIVKLTVTNFSTGEKKPHVVLLGRLRPAETFGSWMLHVGTM